MKVYVTTSDWYNCIIPGFAYLFNKHWSPDQEVTVLCYNQPDYSLPKNFSIISLGNPEQFGNDVPEWSPGRRGETYGQQHPTPRWTNSLKPFFEKLEDEYFILLQIDYFIHKPVELHKVELLKKYLGEEGVVKIDLSYDRSCFPHKVYAVDQNIEIIVSEQDTVYRSSLQAAIWQKDYFVNLLKPDRSPWQFEGLGMYEQMNDGKLILGIKQPGYGPVPYINAYTQGEVNWPQIKEMNAEILTDMVERGLISPAWNGWVNVPDGFI
jgi:hypothetical protein